MFAAIADGRAEYYLTVGMVAAVNPCGFAMLPAYLSYFLGTDDQTVAGAAARPLQAVRVAAAVSLGFMTVFAIAGTLVQAVSAPVYEYMPWISIVIGAGLVVLGIAMLAGFELEMRIPRLERGGRDRTMSSMYLFGVSYAVCSTGCTLPLFLVTVAGTMQRQSFGQGIVVFLIYAAGMALVLNALTVTTALARSSLLRLLRSTRQYVQPVSGTLVALAGGYVVYYAILELRTYRAQGGAIPSSGLTNQVTDISYAIADWIQQIGPAGLGLFLVVLIVVGLLVGHRRHDRAAPTRPETRGPTHDTGDRATEAAGATNEHDPVEARR